MQLWKVSGSVHYSEVHGARPIGRVIDVVIPEHEWTADEAMLARLLVSGAREEVEIVKPRRHGITYTTYRLA